jgi:hypothetical protein
LQKSTKKKQIILQKSVKIEENMGKIKQLFSLPRLAALDEGEIWVPTALVHKGGGRRRLELPAGERTHAVEAARRLAHDGTDARVPLLPPVFFRWRLLLLSYRLL